MAIIRLLNTVSVPAVTFNFALQKYNNYLGNKAKTTDSEDKIHNFDKLTHKETKL